MPEKKKEKKLSWVAKLKKKVRKLLAIPPAKRSTRDTTRTKDIQHQLKKAGVKVKTDQERAEDKRKKSK